MINKSEIDAITGAAPPLLKVSKKRSWALETPGAKKLLAELPPDIKTKLIRCYLMNDVTNGTEEILNYLANRSEIVTIIKSVPSSALAFEYLYRFKEAETPIDKYFVNSLSGYHVYLRLKAVEKNLYYWIKKFVDKGDVVMIDNMGSGPGHDVINVLEANPQLRDIVHVRNIDVDGQALEIGQLRVDKLRIKDSFSFIRKSFIKTRRRNAHIVILVGILCTLSYEICLKIIKLAARYLRPGGILIHSTNQVVMSEWDPLTDFLMRLAGWCMDYKTDVESATLTREAGLHYITQFFDEYLHFQCMTVARRPP